MDDEVKSEIEAFVKKRIKLIRGGKRKALDKTYEGLYCRNEYNSHDYDWYLDMIEQGFGGDLARIDIVSFKQQGAKKKVKVKGKKKTARTKRITYPFSLNCVMNGQPDYKVYVTMVDGRQTLWLLHYNDEDGWKVALPAFAGRTKDQVARGECTLENCAPPPDMDAEKIFQFVPDLIVEQITSELTMKLLIWKEKLAGKTVRAMVVDCFPWHRQANLCILTSEDEHIGPDDNKFDEIASWTYAEDDDSMLGSDGFEALYDHYENESSKKKPQTREKEIFTCIARALASKAVDISLDGFKRTDDFELAVFHPDKMTRNYCKTVR